MLWCLNKPYGVLCQFMDTQDRPTLADLIGIPGIYPCGRLDMNSEGLLLLTDDGALQNRISHPDHKLEKTYCVQVEGAPTHSQLERLRRGVGLKDGLARALRVDLVGRKPAWVWKRSPPVAPRKGKATAWVEIVLTEGRNRQVRRMSAAVGLPVLRLIRTHIGPYSVVDLQPGVAKEVAVVV